MYIIKLSYKADSGEVRTGDFFSGFGAAYISGYEIFEPVLETTVNTVGHFTFTVYPSHPLYAVIEQPKALLEIIRYGDIDPVFVGRIAECHTGMYNEKIVTFESEIAFLLDSIWTDFSSNTTRTASGWIEHLLNFHNDHSGNYGSIYTNNISRKFKLGKVSESFDKTEFSVDEKEFSGSFSILEIITRLLVEKYGGVLKIRHENDENFVDWLDENDIPQISQKIVLGENLLSIEKGRTVDEIVTAIRPVGENVDAKPLNLLGFNCSDTLKADMAIYYPDHDVKQVINTKISNTADGSMRYTDCLYSEGLVEKYGWIQREISFDGVSDRTELVRRGVGCLMGVEKGDTITVNAVDLASGKNDIDRFSAGDFAVVSSVVHGMSDRKMLVQSVSLNLSDPSSSTITLGGEAASITSQVGGSYQGSFTCGGGAAVSGKFDVEGSSAVALGEAKKYTDGKVKDKVDKIDGKGLSTNDFTDGYKNQIDTNKSDIANLKNDKVEKIAGMGLSQNSFTDAEKTKLEGLENYDDSAVKSDISILKTCKANASDVYTKSQTDSRITEKVSEIVAGAPEEFDTLKEMSDWLSEHEDSAAAMNSKISSNSTLITNLGVELGVASDRIDDVESDVAGLESNKADKTTVTSLITEFSAAVKKISEVETDIGNLQNDKANKSEVYTKTESDGKYAEKTTQTSLITEFSAAVKKISELENVAINGYSIHRATAGAGSTGYIKFASLKILHGFIDEAIKINYSNRAFEGAITIKFFNTSSLDPALYIFAQSGRTSAGLYTVKTSASNWDFYIQKEEAYAQFDIVDIFMPHDSSLVTWTWKDEYAATLPEGYITAITDVSRLNINGNAKTADYATASGTVNYTQNQIYSLTSGSASPLGIIVPNLFTAYKLLVCNIQTSTGWYSCQLPMQYIKYLGTSGYYTVSTSLMFRYIDDNTMRIFTGLGQSNPTISKIELIAIY